MNSSEMSNQSNTSNQQEPASFSILLDIQAPDEADEADIAAVGTIGRETIAGLAADGFTIHPIATGQRGDVNFVVEVATSFIRVLENVRDHHALYEQLLADAANLVTLISSGVVPVLAAIQRAHKKQQPVSNTSALPPFKVTIAEKSILVEAPDAQQASDVAFKLAQQFYTSHPATAKQVTSKSPVTIQTTLPKKQKRQRR